MIGVRIGKYHSWDDWGLYLKNITVETPERKKYQIPVEGMDGVLDLSEFLTGGDQRYENRRVLLEFEFIDGDYSRMYLMASKISNAVNGKKLTIVLDDNQQYYYIGVVSVEFDKTNRMISSLDISIDANPYKFECFSSLEKWEWGSFCFADGIIREYKDLKVTDTYTLIIPGRRKKVVPVFDCSAALQLTYAGKTYNLPVGKSKILDLQLGDGEHYLVFTGNGVVSVDYRGASL